MRNLITDRTEANVSRLRELLKKGWQGMSDTERSEWLGDPIVTPGANLIPQGPYYSSTVKLDYKQDAIIATNLVAGGTYYYAISIVGEAEKFENKTFTLSLGHIRKTGSGSPQIALYWHDDNGSEYAGASLSESGSVTFEINENSAGRAYLALYVYVTTNVVAPSGAIVRFGEVMLELGSEKHEYVPYSEIVPTTATKGAYNYSDLNRVERVVSEISDELGLNLVTKTDWKMWDIPRSEDMERFLNNIREIRAALPVRMDIPETINKLTYDGANNIEKVLLGWYESNLFYYRSNEIYCGEV